VLKARADSSKAFRPRAHRDGNTNVSDVPLAIDAALSASAPAFHLNGDGFASIADVQIVVNAIQGMGCSAGQQHRRRRTWPSTPGRD